MKKVMFLLAVAGLFSFAACNNAAETEEVVDSTMEELVEEAPVMEEQIVDSTVEAVAEVAEAVAE